MDTAHLHLVLNHLPVLGTLFGALGLAYGLWRKSRDVVAFSLGLFVLSGLAAGAAYLTGEGAEEVVERAAGASEVLLERHEDASFYALIAAGVLGVFALGTLALFRQTVPRAVVALLLVLALGAGGLMAWTANLGGQIRRPELRSGPVAEQWTAPPSGEATHNRAPEREAPAIAADDEDDEEQDDRN